MNTNKIDGKYYCRCCGYNSLYEEPKGEYNICTVCFWEDDPFQFKDPNDPEGANRVSLIQAQKNYEKFGACERDMIKNCSKPHNLMKRNPNWKLKNAI